MPPPSHQHDNQARIRAPLSVVSVSFAFVALDEHPGGFGDKIELWIGCWSNVPKLPGDSPLVGFIQK